MTIHQKRLSLIVWSILTSALAGSEPELVGMNSPAGQTTSFACRPPQLWQGEIGDGFCRSVQTLELKTGGAAGVQIFGSHQTHDLSLTSLSYGHMWGAVGGTKDHWYRGNWEVRGELFGGAQFTRADDWVVGMTPHLRYDFATGTRWIPFADAGAGVSATGIGSPDLGGTFEFNLQLNAGVHWFMRDNLALTLEAGYLHLSCASIDCPNLGVNGFTGMVGVTWFF